MVVLDPTQRGSRPVDYGCRNCDGSTYSYVTGIYYSSMAARDHAERSIVDAKQAKIEFASNVARLEKLSYDIAKRNKEFEEKIILMAKAENQKIENQNITFKEQTNSGDFNETPITDINLDGGCSECTTGTDLETGMTNDQLEKEGYHKMPDGSLMKDSDMEKKPLNNNMKIAGIAAAGVIGVIGLLLYTKGGLK